MVPTRVVLHVGCGPARREKLHPSFHDPDWREFRVDIDPAVKPDLVASITAMPAVPTSSVDAVWSSHNLEHLYAHEVPIALTEFLRVLKPGGHLLVTMPDLLRVAEAIVASNGDLDLPVYQSPAGPIAAADIMFGFRRSVANGNTFMAHRTGFTLMTLARQLSQAGYVSILAERRGFDLWAKAYKPA